MHQDYQSSDHVGTLYDKIHQIDKRVTVVEETLQELSSIKKDVHSIKELLEQGRGAFKFIQLIVWIVGPIAGFIYWWKEHVH